MHGGACKKFNNNIKNFIVILIKKFIEIKIFYDQ